MCGIPKIEVKAELEGFLKLQKRQRRDGRCIGTSDTYLRPDDKEEVVWSLTEWQFP
jgi:hypothetical protein